MSHHFAFGDKIFAYNTAYTATVTVTIDENYKTNETTKINGSEITVNEEGEKRNFETTDN